MTSPGSSPPLFQLPWVELHPALVRALGEAPPRSVLDDAIAAWLELRGRGGATGTNALLMASAARSLCGLGGDDARAAAVTAIGFLQHAWASPHARQPLPTAEEAEAWTGWGDELLLEAAFGPRGDRGDDLLVVRACRALVVRPKLRQVRGVLLASAVGPSEAARARVGAFLGSGVADVGASELDGSGDRSGAFREALSTACRLDGRTTLGHVQQLAAVCRRYADRSDDAGTWSRRALLASRSTWSPLARHWGAFRHCSSA